MITFHSLYPQIAQEETRYVTWTRDDVLPKGQFAYVESYCEERGCDCENVLLSVMSDSGEHFATINYDIHGAQHRRLGVPRTFLDPLNPQSEFAAKFLELFRQVVLDDTYQERLERHLRLVKAKVGAAETPLPARPATGRNDRCPCGSGLKFKRCCGGVGPGKGSSATTDAGDSASPSLRSQP